VHYKQFYEHQVGDHVFVTIIGKTQSKDINLLEAPLFLHFPRSLSVFGVLLCISIMFIASWYFALVAMLIAIVIYKFIEYKG